MITVEQMLISQVIPLLNKTIEEATQLVEKAKPLIEKNGQIKWHNDQKEYPNILYVAMVMSVKLVETGEIIKQM